MGRRSRAGGLRGWSTGTEKPPTQSPRAARGGKLEVRKGPRSQEEEKDFTASGTAA